MLCQLMVHERSIKLAACALFDARLALLFALVRDLMSSNCTVALVTEQSMMVMVLDVTRMLMLFEAVVAVAMTAIKAVTMINITAAAAIVAMAANVSMGTRSKKVFRAKEILRLHRALVIEVLLVHRVLV